MPKGVYARKSARQKPAGKGKAPVEAKASAAPAVTSAPQAQPVSNEPKPPFSAEDFRRPIADMKGDLLRAFARRVGVSQRDVDGLTEDRLRQNCTALQLAQLED